MDASSQLIAQSHPDVARSLQAMKAEEIEGLLNRLVMVADPALFVHPEIGAYRGYIQSGRLSNAAWADRLRFAADELDEKYFRIRETGGSEGDWAPPFHQARLASALSLMADDHSRSSIADIVYELAHAHDPPTAFLDRVQAILLASS